LIVASVLWTARPPARPVLGAEATMAEPAGPMTFRCPPPVRSTCPPARCTAATISLASLERQRFGVACFFSAITRGPQRPEDSPHGAILDSAPSARKRPRHRAAPPERHRGTAGTAGRSSHSVRAGSVAQRSRTGIGGHHQSLTVRTNPRSRVFRLKQLG